MLKQNLASVALPNVSMHFLAEEFYASAFRACLFFTIIIWWDALPWCYKNIDLDHKCWKSDRKLFVYFLSGSSDEMHYTITLQLLGFNQLRVMSNNTPFLLLLRSQVLFIPGPHKLQDLKRGETALSTIWDGLRLHWEWVWGRGRGEEGEVEKWGRGSWKLVLWRCAWPPEAPLQLILLMLILFMEVFKRT